MVHARLVQQTLFVLRLLIRVTLALLKVVHLVSLVLPVHTSLQLEMEHALHVRLIPHVPPRASLVMPASISAVRPV